MKKERKNSHSIPPISEQRHEKERIEISQDKDLEEYSQELTYEGPEDRLDNEKDDSKIL